MPAALRTHPKLIGLPGIGRHRIAQLHVRSAALTADVQTDFAHALGFYTIPS